MFSGHPRLRGVVIIVGAAACLAINFGTIRAWHEYRVLLFPFAFAMLPVGVAVSVTGWRPGQRMDRRVARGMIALMVVGVIAGLALNRAVVAGALSFPAPREP